MYYTDPEHNLKSTPFTYLNWIITPQAVFFFSITGNIYEDLQNIP